MHLLKYNVYGRLIGGEWIFADVAVKEKGDTPFICKQFSIKRVGCIWKVLIIRKGIVAFHGGDRIKLC